MIRTRNFLAHDLIFLNFFCFLLAYIFIFCACSQNESIKFDTIVFLGQRDLDFFFFNRTEKMINRM